MEQTDTGSIADELGLSRRGAYNYLNINMDAMEKMLANPWSPENPGGTIVLGVAENSLMHQEISKYFLENVSVRPAEHLTYGKGPKGSPRLREALAWFFNTNFKAREKVTEDKIIVLSGVGSVVDSMAWAICNEGEGIMIPRPLYAGFRMDIPTRNRAVIVPASFQDLQGYKGLDDVFDPEFNRKAFEQAYDKALAKGITVKAVILIHPHNPLGRPYPVETLKEVARFCSEKKLHLISDEIYANCVFLDKGLPFVSILAVDLDGIIDPRFVHVTYGASKDFCANGLRLGALYSRNPGLLGAVASNCIFSWPSYVIQDVWAKMLRDEEWRSSFFAENHKRMREHFAITTGFFKKHDISYYENMNSAVFIWVDFRRWLLRPGEDLKAALPRLRVGSGETDMFRAREAEVLKACLKEGVMIGHGTNFFTEELGWFRIGFTTSKEALVAGLERVLKGLAKAQSKWA
ncbi:putative Acc synthase [Pleurostoma richardsiae]|uniref:Acc synthase n=1 Tax=Pleurostoma richardsiae TaxID=41990 RepID=A0AA38REJ6_9PEZI|nr:putative Acc synthase [Pleurostoma richardsiae]